MHLLNVDDLEDFGNFQPEHQQQAGALTLEEFASRNISMRLCSKYIPNPAEDQHDRSETACYCNRSPQWHRDRGISVDVHPLVKEKWKAPICAAPEPTNACGRMKLAGFGRLGAAHRPRYIRIDSETRNFEALWELMTGRDYWNLPRPDLVLSVNGGAKKMENMSAKLMKRVKQGLIDVVSGVKTAWIVTPGFNLGCSQLVGQAIQEYNFAGGGKQIWVIGVCAWGAVYNRECLEISNKQRDLTNYKKTRGQGRWERQDTVEYANCADNPGRGQAAIEPNHTHFIFCDNGSLRYFGTEIDFKTEFEQYIIKKLKTMVSDAPDAFNPPVVQMVIEGGKKAVLTAGTAAEAGTPVITVHGSGRAANELAYFRNIRSIHRNVDDEFVKRKIKGMLDKYQPTWKCSETECKDITQFLLQFSKEDKEAKFDCNMLSVFNAELDEDMTKTILYTLFQHKDFRSSTMTQVRLCMAWQRADIAASEIFAEAQKSKWKGMNLQRAMKEALNKQQVDFVKLFLEHGIDLSTFLTIETLTELYAKMFRSGTSQADRLLHKLDRLTCCSSREISSSAVLRTSFEKNPDQDLVLDAVNRLLRIYTEYAVDHLYSENNLRDNPMAGASPLAQPLIQEAIFPPYDKSGKRRFTSQDLFLWSILTYNVDLAILFWKHGKDQIGSALIGYAILNNMAGDAEKRGEMEIKEQLTRDAQRFEQLAVGVLEECNKDRAICRLLLIRSLPYWNRQTVMAIAEANQCMDLMYQTPVQTVLTQTWMGGMESDTSNWRVILCLFLPFLVPLLIFNKGVSSEADAIGADAAAVAEDAAHGSDEAPETQRRITSMMKDVEMVDIRGPHAREAMEDLHVEAEIAEFSRKSKRELRLRKLRHQKQGFRTMNFCTSLVLFYSAPICKFILNVVSTVLFLLLFSYIALVQLHPVQSGCRINDTFSTSIPEQLTPFITFPQPHGIEIYLLIWAISYIIEEFRQFFCKHQPVAKKLRELSYWDKFDVAISVLFVLCLILRCTLSCQNFDWVRNAYALALALNFIRFMQFYYPSQTLGPKVIMIINMLNDVIFFICILIIFILAYGVAYFSLLTNTTYNYVNKQFDFNTIARGVFYVPYFQLFGNLNLESIDQGATVGGSRNWLVVALMALFILGTNILLINLLITMFGHTFDKVQSESDKYYAYIRHDLIYEYYTRPAMPPPLILIEHAVRFFCMLRRKCCGRACCRRDGQRKYDDFTMELELTEHKRLSAIEQRGTDRFLRRCPEAANLSSTAAGDGGGGGRDADGGADDAGWDIDRAVGGDRAQDDDTSVGELREKLREMEEKFARVEDQMKNVAQSNVRMLQILEHLGSR